MHPEDQMAAALAFVFAVWCAAFLALRRFRRRRRGRE